MKEEHTHYLSPPEVVQMFLKENYRRESADILTVKMMKTRETIVYLQTTIKKVMFDKHEKKAQLR